MVATRSDKVMPRVDAISLSPRQNASSRLTLVLCPAITMDRLTTGDFIHRLLVRALIRRVPALPCWLELARARARALIGQTQSDLRRHAGQLGAASRLFVRYV